MSNHREADLGHYPDLHLVTSETTFSHIREQIRPHDRALGATPSNPGHDATSGLELLYHARQSMMQHNHVTLIARYLSC